MNPACPHCRRCGTLVYAEDRTGNAATTTPRWIWYRWWCEYCRRYWERTEWQNCG